MRWLLEILEANHGRAMDSAADRRALADAIINGLPRQGIEDAIEQKAAMILYQLRDRLGDRARHDGVASRLASDCALVTLAVLEDDA